MHRSAGTLAILPTAWLIVTIPGCQLESGGIGSTTSTGGGSSGETTSMPSGSGAIPSTGNDDDGTSGDPSGSTTGPPGDWPEQPYQWRTPIRIHPGVELSEFPVAILVPDDGDLAANALPDGTDLAVMASDGTTPLPFELEHYEGEIGSLTLWVDAGDLAAGQDTRVYLYYGYNGDDEPPEPPPTADTWPDRFESVWHMGVSDETLFDSTDDPHTALAQDPDNAASSQPGIAGQSADFDGIDDVHDAGDPGDGSLDAGTDSFTVSFWALMTMNVGQFDTPLYKGASQGNDPGYGFYFRTDVDPPNWVGGIVDSVGSAQYLQLGVTADLIGPDWHHVVMTIDRDEGRVRSYLDGDMTQDDPLMELEAIESDSALVFSNPLNPFRGRLDEVRIQRAAVDADWVQAEWTNLSDPEAFFTVDPAQERP
ncbi:MAG: LamG-like jellyroll fold domain-containing protein [Myxococcota bacterium]